MKIYHFSVITCSVLLSIPFMLLALALCFMLPLLGAVVFVAICILGILGLRKLSISFNQRYGIGRVSFALCAALPAMLIYAAVLAACYSEKNAGMGLIFLLSAPVCFVACLIMMVCLIADAVKSASDVRIIQDAVCDSEEANRQADYYLEHGEIIANETVDNEIE